MISSEPQFAVFRRPGFTEYRVENWRLARDGTGRIIMGASGWKWYYSFIPLLLSMVHENPPLFSGLVLILLSLVYSKCTQVLYESVIIIPPHGIQLETHRGLPWFSPFAVNRQFIPLEQLQDFVIHEGLQGWNVRYYLAAIRLSGPEDYRVHVAFENLLPHFPILLEVYRGVQTTLTNL